ncbi:MAG: hypothetical protein LCH59_06215 [Proteobacteria bacterium]|jgi:hypothetical protein|nr:hypothetical protein [Pseudomonadota bacterium]
MTRIEQAVHFAHHRKRIVTLAPKVSAAHPSAAAPIAAGRSDSCQVGFAPTGTPCLVTAHEKSGLAAAGLGGKGVLFSLPIHANLARFA